MSWRFRVDFPKEVRKSTPAFEKFFDTRKEAEEFAREYYNISYSILLNSDSGINKENYPFECFKNDFKSTIKYYK